MNEYIFISTLNTDNIIYHIHRSNTLYMKLHKVRLSSHLQRIFCDLTIPQMLRCHKLVIYKKILSIIVCILISFRMYCLGEHPQLGPIGYFDMQLPFWVCMIATDVVYILLLSWYSSDIVNSCDIEGDIDDHVHICKLNSRFLLIYIFK